MNSSISNSKAFVLAFAAVLGLGLAVAAGGTEAFLHLRVAPYDGYEAYKSRFLTSAAATAAFGDSHVANGMATTKEFDNFGQPSDALPTMAAKIEARLARGGLRQVVLQADPQMFASYRLLAEQKDRIDDLLDPHVEPLLILRPQYRQYLTDYTLTALMQPSLLWTPPAQAGHADAIFAEQPPEQRSRDADMRAQLHVPASASARAGAMARYRALAVGLSQRGVRVCMVGFPVSSDYRKAAARYDGFAQARRFFAEVARETGIRYVDYADSQPDTAFGDPDHLRAAVVKDFSVTALAHCFNEAKT